MKSSAKPAHYAIYFLLIKLFDELAHALWNIAAGTMEPATSSIEIVGRPICGVLFLVLLYLFWIFNRWFFQDEVG